MNEHKRQRDSARYGRRHRLLRRALLPLAYGKPCHFCGRPMEPGQRLHLDHTADGTGWRGMSHASCNDRDAGRRAHKGYHGSAIPPA